MTLAGLSYALWLTRNVLGGLAVLLVMLVAMVAWRERERD